MPQNEIFVKRAPMPVTPAELYAWHEHPGALEKLTPPWEKVRLVERPAAIANGTRAVLETSVGPIKLRWVAEHFDVEPGVRFKDRQVSGPFAFWEHTHSMLPDGKGQSILEDRVEYRLRFGFLGRWVVGGWIRRKLDRLFEYRHQTTLKALQDR